MPKGKVRHSNRVRRKLKKLPKHIQYAGLFHDYLERGGDLTKIKKTLPKKSIRLVKLLTADDEDSPLKHMKAIISAQDDEELINFLILIKLADRVDNFNKRVNKDNLSDKYKKKTEALVSYLVDRYSGDSSLLREILK